MSKYSSQGPYLFSSASMTPELLGFAQTLRERIAAGLDFEVDFSENLDGWVPNYQPRRAPSKSPSFVVHDGDEDSRRPEHWSRRWPLPAWVNVRVLGPREGKEAVAVIAHHNGFTTDDAGEVAADVIEATLKEVCGEQMTVVRIAMDESPSTAYQVAGTLPPFASLLRYRNAVDAEKAAAFWKCGSGADAAFLWYPSAGHDTRPLAWFLPRTDNKPRAAVDYFVLSGLGDPTFERLVRSTLRNGAAGKVLFEDRVSRLSVIESVPFSFDEERVLWFVGDSYTFRDGHEQPIIRGVNGLLVRTRFESRQLGTFEQNLVLVEMENSAFELEVVKEGFLNPVVFCGVRDGCGFGGNRRCENCAAHIEELIKTRTFTPAWWVTDHIQYLDEAGISRSHWFGDAGPDEGVYLNTRLTPRLWMQTHERKFGVGFIELFDGRSGGISGTGTGERMQEGRSE